MEKDWSTEELLKWDQDHILHPACPVGKNVGIVFNQGQGDVRQSGLWPH